MKLVVPTDFKILEAMSNGQRQTAPNLAEILDQRRQYMNDRLSALSSMELVRKVGPSNRSSMYEITSKGLIALDYRDQYAHNQASDFAEVVEDYPSDRVPRGKIDKIPYSELVEYVYIDTEYLEEILGELESRDLLEREDSEEERYYTIRQPVELIGYLIQKQEDEKIPS